ncbi:MAG: polysaccharide deacetylase family protein [Fibrobacter sp.]|nr:polysaccharide deacetylase family protein [Fibrobacter sp.]
MIMNKKLIVGAAVIAFGATVASSQEIATWAGFRKGAASFTFDDGAPSHVTDGAPVFDKYGYKGTFNLVYNWNPNWSGFQQMANNGHEIASHSNSHGNNMSGEEASSKTNIQGKINQDGGIITVAYPNCNVPNQSAVNQNYIAGRICNGSWQGVSDIMGKDGPSDWTKVPALMTGSEGSIKSTSDFTGQMQKAMQQNGWVMFLTHGFQGKSNGSATYSPTDLSAIDGALSWAKQNDADIWITTFRDGVMYVKERKASKIETVSGAAAGTMEFKLTHNIADNICKYQYPLSIRVKNSNNWTKVTATQNSKAIDVSIKDGYIYFDAVPNGGNIVLTSGDAPAPASSSSAAAPASSSSIAAPASSSSAIAPASSSSGTLAIGNNVVMNVVSGVVKCSVFDVNGHLLKSSYTAAGAANDMWNRVNVGLGAGVYIMRYGEVGKTMQTVRVRK